MTLVDCLKWVHDQDPTFSVEWISHHSIPGDNCWAKTTSLEQAVAENKMEHFPRRWWFYDPLVPSTVEVPAPTPLKAPAPLPPAPAPTPVEAQAASSQTLAPSPSPTA